MRFKKSFTTAQDACALAHAIVDTVRDPIIVLDGDLRVIVASRSFYRTFEVDAENTEGKLLYELGDGAWNIPKLRLLLEKIIPEHGTMEDFEVEHEFPLIGSRTMCLNARQVFYEGGAGTTILLGIEDITEKHKLQRANDDLLRQKDVLHEELQHRVGNSLQIMRKHYYDEGAGGRFGRGATSSSRHTQASPVGRDRSATATYFRCCRAHRNGPLSFEAL